MRHVKGGVLSLQQRVNKHLPIVGKVCACVCVGGVGGKEVGDRPRIVFGFGKEPVSSLQRRVIAVLHDLAT